jgi:hypothetical protein
MKIKTIHCFIAALTLCLAVAFFLCSFQLTAVYAQTNGYSEVLYDLEKSENFYMSDYRARQGDYSLNVITLAESEDNELFVYVYQPSGEGKNLRASSINISLGTGDDLSYKNYKLEFIDSEDVFYKYLVEGLTVSFSPERYYSVSSIFRPFDENIDKQAEDGNKITEVVYEVAKQYCFTTKDGQPYVEVVDIQTIEVTDKFVGFVRYSDGFKLYVGACDSHFVAFNTDKPMDKLLEADVYYTSQSYSYSFITFVGESHTFGEKQDNYAYLTYTDRVEHNGGGLFAGTYTWDRIETVDEFISENEGWQNVYSGAIIDINVGSEITEEGKAALKGKKWVLRFAETGYSLNSGYGSVTSFSTLVGDVTILRLKFETDGEVYNLGVIDNKQTGSDKPVNNEWISAELSDNFKLILSIILLVLAILLLVPLFRLIFKGIGKLKRKNDKPGGGRDLDKMSREEVEKELDKIDWNSDFWKNIDGTDDG